MKKISSLLMILICLFAVTACKSNTTGKDESGNSKDIKGTGLPQIHIVSTENEKGFEFVTVPISKVVVEASKAWLPPDDPALKTPEPWYEKCNISVYDKKGKNLLDNVTGQVKVRGNWSSSYDKKPLRIKFDEKQVMLDMHNGTDYKNWVLLAEYKDFSFLRNATALKLAKLINNKNYNSDYEFVEVYINDEYWGVYLLAEQQENKKGKVKLTEDSEALEIGYFIEYDSNAWLEDYYFEMDYKYPLTDFYGEEIEKGTSLYSFKSDVNAYQKEFIASYMNNLWELCYKAAYDNEFYKFDENYELVKAEEGEFANAKECISSVVDLDSLVEVYLHQEIVCDPDIYINSFFMDLDLSPENYKKLTFEAAWDFDSALGNKRQCADAQGVWAGAVCRNVNFEEGSRECNPWLMIFINCDWFKQMVSEKWNKLTAANALSELTNQIDNVTKVYKDNFAKNSKKWVIEDKSFGGELNEETSACTTQQESAEYLKNWLTNRFTALDKIWSTFDAQKCFVTFDYDDGRPKETVPVTKGEKVSKPENPENEGMEFRGWYCGEQEFDFNTPINNNTVLTARWFINEATSAQGRLTVRNTCVEGNYGLEVTVRWLNEEDVPDGDEFDRFIRIQELGIERGIDNPTLKEPVVLFLPFLEKDRNYTITYIHADKDWTEEDCTVTGAGDGININDCFTDDIWTQTVNIKPSSDKYSFKIDKNIKEWVKDNSPLKDINLSAVMVVGKEDWSNAEWIRAVNIYDDENMQKALSAEGLEFTNWENWEIENLTRANAEPWSDTWFVQLEFYFRCVNDDAVEYRIEVNHTRNPASNPKIDVTQ